MKLLSEAGGVGGGGEFDERLDGAVSESGEDVGQVAAYGDIEPAAAFDNREDGSDLRSSFFASQVQPVTSSDRNGPH